MQVVTKTTKEPHIVGFRLRFRYCIIYDHLNNLAVSNKQAWIFWRHVSTSMCHHLAILLPLKLIQCTNLWYRIAETCQIKPFTKNFLCNCTNLLSVMYLYSMKLCVLISCKKVSLLRITYYII